MELAKGRRFESVDCIRGITAANMILYHFLYDVFMVYGLNPAWISYVPVRIWQNLIAGTFILISGLSVHLGKHPVKRGILLNIWGLLITAATLLFLPEEAIFYGILTGIGCMMLVTAFVEKWLVKIPPAAGLIGNGLLFILTRNIDDGYLTFGKWVLLRIPEKLYLIKPLTVLGLPHPDFCSSDYFPVFPWLFLFFVGYYLWYFIHPILNKELKLPVFNSMGRKSLFWYLIHQPLCMLVCMLVF